jgi:hypothetical protein
MLPPEDSEKHAAFPPFFVAGDESKFGGADAYQTIILSYLISDHIVSIANHLGLSRLRGVGLLPPEYNSVG